MSKAILRGRPEVLTAALGVAQRVRRQRHGGVVLLEGEAGIGKSAVFAEIVTQVTRIEQRM